jgi:hypothetical protein
MNNIEPVSTGQRLVAHLSGLNEDEFTNIFGTFPLVQQPVRVAAHNPYRDVARGLVK